MGISVPGVGSGLDVKAMVDAIVNSEVRFKVLKHDQKVTRNTTELSALGLIKGQLASFQSTLKTLSDPTNSYAMKHTMSDATFFNTTLTSEALAGVYHVTVKQLAQQQSIASTYYPDSTATLGTGTVTINLGSYNSDNTTFTKNTESKPLTLTLTNDNNSLSAVCDAINNAKAGVTANIVQDAQGVRLSLTSTSTGLDQAMQITGTVDALKYDPTTSQTTLTQTMAAQNSAILINGLEITQGTNQIKDAVKGITLNLKKADVNTSVTLTVDNNKEQLSNLMTEFIKQYNDSVTLLNNMTKYEIETKKSGPFQGDAQIRNLKFELNKWTTGNTANQSGPLKSLSDLGIKTNRSGLLEMDKVEFQKNLDENYQQIGALFTQESKVTETNKGLAVVLNQFLDSYTGKEGRFDIRTDKLKLETKALDIEQKKINANIELLTQRYTKKFNALDSLISSLSSQSDSLSQMLGNLPQMTNRRNR